MGARTKPLLVFDGDCGFCRVWVRRWQAITGNAVDYAPYQEVASRFPDIPESEFASSVHLIDSDGSVHRGAEAVFRSLGHARRGGAALWVYRNVPLAARISELCYRLIASNRRVASAVTTGLGLGADDKPDYQLTRSLLLRGIGVVYFLAFVSLWTQVDGLFGSRGIVPVESYLSGIYDSLGSQAYVRVPTLFWLSASDTALHVICAAGTLASVLLTAGVLPPLAAAVCWLAYLSILNVGQVFLSFQWDILLLEAGFLTVLLAPRGIMPTPATSAPVNRPVVWAFRWLVFRLIVASGLVKLLSGDPSWRDLTALTYHYESQPLPPWTAWYAHQLPEWFHVASAAAMFGIELIVPFCIFAPRRLRLLAFVPLVGLQIVIAATGNYCFFNLLTVVLCLSLLDDDALARFLPARRKNMHVSGRHRPPLTLFSTIVTTAAVTAVLILSAAAFTGQLLGHGYVPRPLRQALGVVRPLHVTSTYGLFAVMTKGRPEIVIEGSNDGLVWKPYDFKWKPGDPAAVPRFVAPHQPRLDWQMWFAALGSYRRNPWLSRLMARLLEGSPPVLALLADSPFPEKPPTYVRAQLYQYEFADRDRRAHDGAWWRRSLVRPYHPVMTKRP